MLDAITIQSLIAELGNNDINIRKEAKRQLLEHGAAIIDPLIEVMRQGNRYQVYEAAAILTTFQDGRCFDALVEMINSPNIMVAQLVVRSLANYGKDRALQQLLDHLPQAHPFTQTQILEVLKEIGDSRAFGPLMTLLQLTDSTTLRYSLIETLGILGATQAIDLIHSFQDDENHHVRDRVQAALKRLENNGPHSGASPVARTS